jgi:Sensors of blue-light using FAD
MKASSLQTEAQRRKAVALVVALTANTHLEPQRYERQLLDQFEQGTLTLDEMTELLDARVYQVLYHSYATASYTEAELQKLLEWSHTSNAEQGITGLLLYSAGRFVQVLEGDEAFVSDLYARIQRDSRHIRVETVHAGLAARQFTGWSMAFGRVSPPILEATVAALQGKQAPPALIVDPLLQKLLRAFT